MRMAIYMRIAPRVLSDKCPIPISELCLVNTDVAAGVGAPSLNTTKNQDAQGDSKDLVSCCYSSSYQDS